MYDGVPSNGVPPGRRRLAGARHRARDAEVRDDRVPFLQQDIAGLDVEMDDALAMRVVERQRDLATESDDVVGRKPRLAAQPIAQRLAGGKRRHEIEESAARRSVPDGYFTRVVQRQDVRMRQTGGDLDLARETLAADEARDVGVQHLHRDLASVLRIVGEIHRRHATATRSRVRRDTVRRGRRGIGRAGSASSGA